MASLSPYAKRMRKIVDQKEDGNRSQAARRLGLSQRGLQKIYTGETKAPGVDVAEKFCRTYPDVDPAWLILGESSEEWAKNHERMVQIARRMVAEILNSLATMVLAGEDDEVIRSLIDEASNEEVDPEKLRAATDRIVGVIEKLRDGT